MSKRIKYYRYRVVKVVTRKSKATVKVGAILLYKRGRGPIHSEVVYSFTKHRVVEMWCMEAVGPCWVEGNKVIESRDYAKKAVKP